MYTIINYIIKYRVKLVLLEAQDLKLLPFKLKCREQYPLLWDSFEQPSFEHNRRHCFPLNFFLIPLGVVTISPFLYL